MGQDSLHFTISEAEVIVNGDSQIQFTSDSLNQAWNNSSSVGALLRSQAGFVSRSYGARGTAITASGQGLSANQFTATWNGFELNSPTLGTVDLGILSPSLFSNVQLNQHSFGVSPVQSSGAGGWLDLSTNNQASDHLRLDLGMNSLRNQSLSLVLPYGIGGVKLVTRVNLVRALNEFDYQDELRRVYDAESNSWEHPEVAQEHNNHNMLGVIQGVSFNVKDWLVDAQVWYQTSHTNLPEIMGSFGKSYAEQSDSSLRATVAIKGAIGRVSSAFSLARFEESQRYTDRQSDGGVLAINSKIRTEVNSARAQFKGQWKKLNWGTVSNFTSKSAKTDNYKNGIEPRMNIWSQSGQLGIAKANTSLDGNVRIDLIQGQRTLPVVDLVAIQRIDKKGHLRMRAAYSKMFRVATFNELYWQSDGMRELNAEEGQKFTLGSDANLQWKAWQARADVQVSYTEMKDMIQWRSESGASTPFNTGDFSAVNLTGRFELIHRTKLKKMLSYQMTLLDYLDAPFWINSSAQKNIDPSIRQNLALNVQLNEWSILAQSSSRKNDLFPGAEPSTVETPIVIHDLGFAYQKTWEKCSVEAQILMENVLDTPNHFLRSYAMPGRIIRMNLILKWIPKNQDK